MPNCFSTWSIRLFLNSKPLSDRMYLGHMWTGKYWLMMVETVVYADSSAIRKASGQPVRWSIMVRMFLFPELEVSHSVTKSMTIFFKWSVWSLHHLKREGLDVGYLSAVKCAVNNVLPNVLVHTLSIILAFYRQYVWVFPWCPNLSWASTKTVYFQD